MTIEGSGIGIVNLKKIKERQIKGKKSLSLLKGMIIIELLNEGNNASANPFLCKKK